MTKLVLASQQIKGFIEDGTIDAQNVITESQVQPASLDLRLGYVAYCVPGEFLPSSSNDINFFIKNYCTTMLNLDHPEGAVLERGKTYLVMLQESYNGVDHTILANPKSTTGRLGISTRLVSAFNRNDENEFDIIRTPLSGPMFLYITPMAFNIRVRSGDTLHQMRFEIESYLKIDELPDEKITIHLALDYQDIRNMDYTKSPSAYQSIESEEVIDLRLKGYYFGKFWKEIRCYKDTMLLNPGHVYIMASKSKVYIKPTLCAEMVPYSASLGEFRIHHAGFFDPGFGYGRDGEVDGAKAVFEITPHVPILLQEGQNVATIKYTRMHYIPDSVYGDGIGSNYQAQDLALAKQFNYKD